MRLRREESEAVVLMAREGKEAPPTFYRVKISCSSLAADNPPGSLRATIVHQAGPPIDQGSGNLVL